MVSWETYEQYPYDDGYGYMTVGYGHKIGQGEDFSGGLTKEAATALYQKDLGTFENVVNRQVKVALTQHEFDALVSLASTSGARTSREVPSCPCLTAETRRARRISSPVA
jgi:lysozyme